MAPYSTCTWTCCCAGWQFRQSCISWAGLQELVAVGQKSNALQTLHDTITNKRQQRNWTKALEQVLLLLSLVVDSGISSSLQRPLVRCVPAEAVPQPIAVPKGLACTSPP
jgi:hypothetical protein